MAGDQQEVRKLVAQPPLSGGEVQEKEPEEAMVDRSLLQAEVELRRAILEMRARSRHDEPWLNLTTIRERFPDE